MGACNTLLQREREIAETQQRGLPFLQLFWYAKGCWCVVSELCVRASVLATHFENTLLCTKSGSKLHYNVGDSFCDCFHLRVVNAAAKSERKASALFSIYLPLSLLFV
jgi:hypothetical protein